MTASESWGSLCLPAQNPWSQLVSSIWPVSYALRNRCPTRRVLRVLLPTMNKSVMTAGESCGSPCLPAQNPWSQPASSIWPVSYACQHRCLTQWVLVVLLPTMNKSVITSDESYESLFLPARHLLSQPASSTWAVGYVWQNYCLCWQVLVILMPTMNKSVITAIEFHLTS